MNCFGYKTKNNRDYNDAHGDDYEKSFYVITTAPESSTTAIRYEVYANLDIVCSDMPGVYDFKLRLRQAHQAVPCLYAYPGRCMYEEIWQSEIEPKPTVKLTAIDGGKIECCRVLKNICRYWDCQWRKYKFYS